MKQLIFSLTAFVLVFFFGMSALTISSKSARMIRFDNASNEVLQETISFVMEHCESADITAEDVGKMMTDAMEKRLGGDSRISITVEGFDPVRGLLSASLTEIYHHPNGREGSIGATKTIILERGELRLQPKAESDGMSFIPLMAAGYYRFIDENSRDTLSQDSLWRISPDHVEVLERVFEGRH